MMELLLEIINFLIYSLGIVVISKYLLVPILRNISKLLGLGPKSTGNIAGVATSVPELLTVVFSAATGFISTSIYNIISSNIINLLQYTFSIFLNKNQKHLGNKAIKIDIIMVIITIAIPLAMILTKMKFDLNAVIFFIILFIFFYYINFNVHKLYLKEVDKEILKEEILLESKEKIIKNKILNKLLNYFCLIIITILLYFVGNLLSNTLENLNNVFRLPEIILGIALGIVTSIPELITFIEAQRKNKGKKSSNELGVIEATNNLLTSNILNLFAIQSIGIIIYTLIS